MNINQFAIEKLDESLIIHTTNIFYSTIRIPIKHLDQKNFKRWINALRSGEYKQTTTGLYDWRNEAFCCLGVFCKINTNDLATDESPMFLTEAQQKPMGEYNFNLQRFFADLNDVYKLNFNRIADIIETMLNIAAAEHNIYTIVTL